MGWVVLGESVTGTSHRARNAPCQDAFRYRVFDSAPEWLWMIVADGAGSAARSEHGATFVCDEFIRRAQGMAPETLLNRDAMTALFGSIRAALIEEAAQLEVAPRELACTVLVALVGPSSAAFAQLGDGAIVIGQNDDHRTVYWPEPAEYANATDFLTDARFADFISFEAVMDSILEVAALTDGLQRLALDYAGRTAYRDFFRPLFRELRGTADVEGLVEPFRNFLDSHQVNQRTDDDKTLVVAVRRP